MPTKEALNRTQFINLKCKGREQEANTYQPPAPWRSLLAERIIYNIESACEDDHKTNGLPQIDELIYKQTIFNDVKTYLNYKHGRKDEAT